MPTLLNQTLQAIRTTKTVYKQKLQKTDDKELQKEIKCKLNKLDKLEKETLCQINQ